MTDQTLDVSTDIITPEFLEKYRNRQPNWGFNGLGYIVYKRTYARDLGDGVTEEWYQTVARCINGAQKIGAGYTQQEAEKLYDYVFNLKANFAGRMLWQLGTPTVDRFGANSLLNCWYVNMQKPEDFCFLFENLMLGGGVGFSVKREDVHQLPKVREGVVISQNKESDADFIVPDSREGWVTLLRKVLNAYFYKGKSFTYSTILVRGAGEKIAGFGGTASGPRILIEGIDKICNILRSREGKKMRSIDVLDICNIIGSVVVAGNVRRSAEIALGDPDDFLFARAKRWDLGNIPNWRAMSNNTIYADSFDQISDAIWSGYEGNGEPYGFFNLPLSQRQGRLGENRRDNCEGTNPCAEISLADKECCNLSELYLHNIESKEELIEVAKLLYKTQKAICAMPFIHEETEKVVHKNMRIGMGVTGVCQALDKLEWLDDAYRELRTHDAEWSRERGWPESIKLTTIKPSGTLSILAGATPGVHPGYSQFHIRRVRMSSNDPLVDTCRELGYHIEFLRNFDGSEDHGTVVVSFPCEFDENTIFAQNFPAVEQLELVKKMQTVWADNAVSVTVYYRPEELDDIKAWLKKNYKKGLKSVSFLLHNEHGFDQAPYEEIDEARYRQLSKKIKPINQGIIAISSGDTLEGIECATGGCPIK